MVFLPYSDQLTGRHAGFGFVLGCARVSKVKSVMVPGKENGVGNNAVQSRLMKDYP